MRGKLIVIDGLDGSGKETQTRMLYERLKNENFKVCTTSFPNYQSKTGELVEMYLSGEFGDVNSVNAYQGSISYAMDRYLSFIKDEWGKKYLDGYLVICDRYTTSNLIHQGSKLPDSELLNYIEWLEDLEYQKLKIPTPDDILFLDIPIDISVQLMRNRLNKFSHSEEKDIHERNRNYLRQCYETSKKICELRKWQIISCTQNSNLLPKEEINEKIYRKILERL